MFINEEIIRLVQDIAELAKANDYVLAVSESCCGGLIASYLVSVPGASKFFVGGTTTYSLKSRLHLSGWSNEDIESYTGPSEDVASRLARNLKLELGATVTLAETGWAGPDDGPSTGTAFLAISGVLGTKVKTIKTGSNQRISNMEEFAKEALQFLLEYLKNARDLDANKQSH